MNHVIFMMQENRTFDTYFGMLNPYRKLNEWNVSDDVNTYNVDGLDDKLTTTSNVDDEGTHFPLFHTVSSCLYDMTSGWLESYGDVSRFDFSPTRSILIDGFVHTSYNFAKDGIGSNGEGSFTDLTGQRAMAYYADTGVSGRARIELLLLHGIAVCAFRSLVFSGFEQEHAEPNCSFDRWNHTGIGERSVRRR